MRTRVSQAAVLAVICVATIGLTVSCGGGIAPSDSSPTSATASPNGTSAHPFTPAWLNNKLLSSEDLSGSKVVKANCRTQHVDAGGNGEYDCVVTMDSGRKYDNGYEVTPDGNPTQLGPGPEVN